MSYSSQLLSIFISTLSITTVCMEKTLLSSQSIMSPEKKRDVLSKIHPVAHYLSGHPDRSFISATWNHDGSILVSAANNIILRNGQTGECIKTINENHFLGKIQFSPNGSRMIYRSCLSMLKNDVVLCDGHTGDHIKDLLSIDYQKNNLTEFSLDSTRILQSISSHNGTNEATIIIYDAITGNVLQKTIAPCSIYTLAYKTDHTFIAGGRSEKKCDELCLYQNGKSIKNLIGNSGEVGLALFNSDFSRLVTASETPYLAQDCNASALVLRDGEGNIIKQLNDHKNTITALAFSPDGKHLVSGASFSNWCTNNEPNLIIWDAHNGDKLITINNQDRIEELVFSHDRTLLIAACFQKIYFYNGSTYELIKILQDTKFLALRPDGNYIATEKDHKLVLWDLFNIDNQYMNTKK